MNAIVATQLPGLVSTSTAAVPLDYAGALEQNRQTYETTGKLLITYVLAGLVLYALFARGR